jgi:hypothetical protein
MKRYQIFLVSSKRQCIGIYYTNKEEAIKMAVLIKKGEFLPTFRIPNETDIEAVVKDYGVVIYQQPLTKKALRKYEQLPIRIENT